MKLSAKYLSMSFNFKLTIIVKSIGLFTCWRSLLNELVISQIL